MEASKLHTRAREHMGEVTDGGTSQLPSGEISYCDIHIEFIDNKPEHIKWLVDLLNRIGIPKGSILQGLDLEIP